MTGVQTCALPICACGLAVSAGCSGGDGIWTSLDIVGVYVMRAATLQCYSGCNSLDDAVAEAGAAGVRVLFAFTARDNSFRLAVCGAPSNIMNYMKIPKEDVPKLPEGWWVLNPRYDSYPDQNTEPLPQPVCSPVSTSDVWAAKVPWDCGSCVSLQATIDEAQLLGATAISSMGGSIDGYYCGCPTCNNLNFINVSFTDFFKLTREWQVAPIEMVTPATGCP